MQKYKTKILAAIALMALVLTLTSTLVVSPTSAQVGRNTTSYTLPTNTGTILPPSYGDPMQYEWPSSGQNSARDRFSAGPGPNSPSVLWQTPTSGSGTITTWKGYAYAISLRSNIANSPLTPPYTGPGATIFKFDALTGQQIWNATEPLPTYIFYPAVDIINDNVLVVTAATGLVGMSTQTGAVLWTVDGVYPTLGPGAGRYFPSLYVPEQNEIIIRKQQLSGVNGQITAYDLGDGLSAPTIKWQYPYEQPVELQAYGNGVVFVGDSTWTIFGLNATNGKLIWYKDIMEQLYFSGIYSAETGYFYTGGGDRYLYAINATTGDIIYQHDYGSFGFVAQGGAFAYGRYYTQFINYTGLYISAIDGKTDKELWSYGINLYQGINQAYIQPGIADGKVYVYAYPGTKAGSANSQVAQPSPFLAVFDAFTGIMLYKIPVASATPTISYGNLYLYGSGYVTAYGAVPKDFNHWRGTNGTGVAKGESGPVNLNVKWAYQTGGAITGPIVAAQGKVYFGSYDKNYYALDAYTGKKIWNFTTGYRIYSAPVIKNGVVYTGADDGYVYALDGNTGAVIWKTFITSTVHQVFGSGLQLRSNPIIDGNNYFVGSIDFNLYSLNIATGTIQWRFPTGGPIAGSPQVDSAKGTVFICSTDLYIYSLNQSNGAMNWQYLTPRGTNQSIGLMVGFESTPVIAQGIVFSGVGYDYKPSGSDQFVALNETTGKRIWGFASDTGAVGNFYNYNAPVYYQYNKTTANPNGIGVFIVPDGEVMMAFNATNGVPFAAGTNRTYIGHEPLASYIAAENQWQGNNLPGRPILYMGTSLYVEKAYNFTKPDNITSLGFYTTAAQIGSTAALYDGTLYVGSGDWYLYALGDVSAQQTSIMAGANADTLNLGKTITVTGALIGPQDTTPDGAYEGGSGGIPNAAITVLVRGPNGEYDQNTTTDQNGVFTISYTPTVAGEWNFLPQFKGYQLRATGYQATEGSWMHIIIQAPPTPTPTPTQTPTTSPSPVVTPTPTQTPTTSPSVVPSATSGALSSETIYIAIAAVVIIIVAALAAVILRRRK